MMCEECGVQVATIRLTKIINGEKQEKMLCSDCMAKFQKTLPSFDIPGLSGLLGGLIAAQKPSSQAESEQASPADETPDIACSRCGMTYEAFKKTGMLGCSNCYNDFRAPLEVLLNRVHGHTQHTGRAPGGEGSAISKKLMIDRLKQKLVKAIAAEEYEEAAALRDEIRALNKSSEITEKEA